MEWLQRIAQMRRWTRGGERDPNKALLLLFALGQLQRKGLDVLRYREIEEALTALLTEFGPPKPASPGYPFHHLAGDGVWEVGTSSGMGSPGTDPGALRYHDAMGRLVPLFAKELLADSGMFAHAVRILLDLNFEPSLHSDLCAAVGLLPEVAETGAIAHHVDGALPKVQRDAMFRQKVLVAYECRCAFCGYEGWVGNSVIGLEAARLRWWAFEGHDGLNNALCLCTLHHRLVDKGVLGLTQGGIILVSRLYLGTTDASRELVTSLAGRRVARPQGGFPTPDRRNIDWHARQVFRGPARLA